MVNLQYYIRISHFNQEYLNTISRYILYYIMVINHHHNKYKVGKTYLPNHRKTWTVNRSPHVHKKSRETFCKIEHQIFIFGKITSNHLINYIFLFKWLMLNKNRFNCNIKIQLDPIQSI